MKLLIDDSLIWNLPLAADASSAERQAAQGAVDEVVAVLRRFSVYCSVTQEEKSVRLRIEAQKVTLTEEDMNELFLDGLFTLFDLTLGYSSLGGSQFCIRILTAQPRTGA